MSNIIDINEFKDEASLQLYAQGLFATLQKSEESVKTLTEKVVHLETLLKSAVSPLAPVPIEQVICELQIKRLHDECMGKQMTLEETKRLDLLIKNLYLAKGQATTISKDNTVKADDLTDEELIRRAKSE